MSTVDTKTTPRRESSRDQRGRVAASSHRTRHGISRPEAPHSRAISPTRVEQDLHDELLFHIEREARKLIDRGMLPDQARATAKAHFGATTVVADQCRDQRGIALVDNENRTSRMARWGVFSLRLMTGHAVIR